MSPRLFLCVVLYFPLFIAQSKIWENVRGDSNFARRRTAADKMASIFIMALTAFECMLLSRVFFHR